MQHGHKNAACPRTSSVDMDTVARSWRSFSANPTTKFRNLAKNSAIFCLSLFSFWELKQVLFASFSLSKFVFYTPNKNFSLAVYLCSAVDIIEPTVYLLLINKNKNNRYFSAISAKVPLQFLAVNIFFLPLYLSFLKDISAIWQQWTWKCSMEMDIQHGE
jgi:hypothetical protein